MAETYSRVVAMPSGKILGAKSDTALLPVAVSITVTFLAATVVFVLIPSSILKFSMMMTPTINLSFSSVINDFPCDDGLPPTDALLRRNNAIVPADDERYNLLAPRMPTPLPQGRLQQQERIIFQRLMLKSRRRRRRRRRLVKPRRMMQNFWMTVGKRMTEQQHLRVRRHQHKQFDVPDASKSP